MTASYFVELPHTWCGYFHVPLVAWTLWLGTGVETALPKLAAGLAAERIATLSRSAPFGLALAAVVVVAIVSALNPLKLPARVYEPMQTWAPETPEREPAARILAADIGAIGYAWRGTVLDSEGLVWPQALEYALPNTIIEAERPDLLARYEAIGRFSARDDRHLDPELDDLSPIRQKDYLLYKRKRDTAR